MHKDNPSQDPQITVNQITMDAYQKLWRDGNAHLDWQCLFVLPFWLDTVCRCLGAPGTPAIFSVSEGPDLIGIAPLALKDKTGYFLGNPEVCDYQDIVSAPGKAEKVIQAVLNHLADMHVRTLDLRTLHPNATALGAIQALADRGNVMMQKMEDDVTYEMTLPDSWETFLLQLNSKQRHEVRRKLRRLDSQADFDFRLAPGQGSIEASAACFIQLFQMNRADKAQFMNPKMADYFRELIRVLTQEEMLRLYFLYVNDQPAATVLCFDYNQVRYLYNSGYDTQYQGLSVGILSKVLSIQKGIEVGCRYYDFLKGAEVYKKRTGGHLVPLFRCKVTL